MDSFMDPALPLEVWEPELEELASMGFTNMDRCLEHLEVTWTDLVKTVFE